MNPDPASLENLRDIVTPPPVPWWPLAPGWYAAAAIVAIVLMALAIRAWRWWRTNTYRRAALRALEGAEDPSEIAAILKRTALAAFPRSEVASLTGEAWYDWLERNGGVSGFDRENLGSGVFGRTEIDPDAMRHGAVLWVKSHRASREPATTRPC